MMRLFSIIFLSLFCVDSFSFSNFTSGQGITEDNRRELKGTSIPYAIARQGQRQANNKKLVTAFFDISDFVYSLSSELSLIRTRSEGRLLENSWPLARWPHQYFSPAVASYYQELHHPYPVPFNYEGTGPGVGCMGHSPLRYGDLESDGPQEIVIILNGLFTVFSVQYERIVFAEPIDESDWMTAAEMVQFFTHKPVTSVQYASRFLAENDVVDAGIRAYAKLYVGQFDGDAHHDILVWRKSYRANAGNNPVPGFTSLGDVYQHFERDLTAQAQSEEGVTGEYLPQETSEDTVRGWLSSNSLTWSAGYPSQSECTGAEGQLIPEMHDPLLNDPEVLPPTP